ncbi:protein of unknown function [Kyrpidia spormannii]|uniref:Uncharacterized protein n=1 Tax=Kyrpidia spormannii TaxID=2055160 RepID=A0A6F9E4W6_9BACL|nr:protein of unknown function [Kyrpidia spormannii]
MSLGGQAREVWDLRGGGHRPSAPGSTRSLLRDVARLPLVAAPGATPGVPAQVCSGGAGPGLHPRLRVSRYGRQNGGKVVILASPERIREYTAEGYWGTETLWDRFRQYSRAHPDRLALVDPPNKEELVGLSPERLTYRELEQAVGRGPSFGGPGPAERRCGDGSASERVGVGNALLGRRPGGGCDRPDSRSVAGQGVQLYRRPHRSRHVHHHPPVSRLQRLGHGPATSRTVARLTGDSDPGRHSGDGPGRV